MRASPIGDLLLHKASSKAGSRKPQPNSGVARNPFSSSVLLPFFTDLIAIHDNYSVWCSSGIGFPSPSDRSSLGNPSRLWSWLETVDRVEAENLVLLHGQVHRTDAGQRLADPSDCKRRLPIHSDAVLTGSQRGTSVIRGSRDPVEAVGGNRALGKG